jgi:hypothetical protein
VHKVCNGVLCSMLRGSRDLQCVDAPLSRAWDDFAFGCD